MTGLEIPFELIIIILMVMITHSKKSMCSIIQGRYAVSSCKVTMNVHPDSIY